MYAADHDASLLFEVPSEESLYQYTPYIHLLKSWIDTTLAPINLIMA